MRAFPFAAAVLLLLGAFASLPVADAAAGAPSLSITSPTEGASFQGDRLTVTGDFDCGSSCAPSPLTGEAHVYQGGLLDPFAQAPEQTTVVAGTPVDLAGRFIASTSASYPVRLGLPARATLLDADGAAVLSLPASALTADTVAGQFQTTAPWESDLAFPAGTYELLIEVGGFGPAAAWWWGLPTIPVRVVTPSESVPSVPSASSVQGPLPPFLFAEPVGPPAPAGLPDVQETRQSGWRDPAAGGNGDYVYIDAPAAGSVVSGATTLSGRAGTSATDPGCVTGCGGGGGSGEDFADDAQVVIAVIDTGANPYHADLRDATRLQHPSEYLTGFPSSVDGVRLCFVDEPAAGEFAYNDDCPASWATARAGDAAQWGTIASSELVWFPGTRMLGISFAHDGQAGYNTLDGTRDLADSSDTHGSWVTSTAAGTTAGTCPSCLVVILEADSVDAIDQAYGWASQQPWIDVVTSSVGYGVIGVGWNPGVLGNGMTPGARNAVQNGKLFFEAAGNGLANAGLVPTSTWLLQSSNPYTVTVGSANENTDEAALYYDLPVDVLGTGHDRRAAVPGSFGGFQSIAGTSFASPSAAGVAAAGLLAARAAVGDVAEGASAAGASKTLLRNHDGVAVPAGPFSNGVLTLDEFREAVLKNAEPASLPSGTHCIGCHVDTPASFVVEGYGALNAGYSGSEASLDRTRSAEIASTLLGTRDLPVRPLEQAWNDAVQAVNEEVWGESRPVMDGDGDAFPRTDYTDCPDCAVPQQAAAGSLFEALQGLSSMDLVGTVLAEHGLTSGLAPGAPAPVAAPVQVRPLGTEAAPESADPAGDGLLPGSDVGNVWVSDDNGTAFDLNLRLNEEHLPSAFIAERTQYGVDFRHQRTGIDYGLRALDDPVVGTGWEFSLQVPSQDGQFTCTLLDHDLQGSRAEGTLITWHVDYADLDVATKPTTSGATCSAPGLGGPARGGDNLTGITGLTSHVIGIVDFGGSFGDSSDQQGAYRLRGTGGGGGGGGNPGCTAVCLTVNGVPLPNATIAPDGTWSASVDFSAFSAPYVVFARHGTANASATYVASSANQAPVANAGTDFATMASYVAELRGTGTDSDGFLVSYSWEQVSGPAVELSSPTNATARFIAPDVSATTTLGFRLTVMDNGNATDTDEVLVQVHPHANIVEASIYHLRATTQLPPNGGAWSVNLTGLLALAPGDHVLTVTAYGAAGQAIASDQVTVHVEAPDADGDGVLDGHDNCPADPNPIQKDLDGDGAGDACDADIDGDGAANGSDAFPFDPSEQADTDGDGVGDNRDAFPTDPAEQFDSDRDGTGDNGDLCAGSDDRLDADGDGRPDGCDLCPASAGGCEGDLDGDQVPDGADNCADKPNPTQANLDGDAKGDACDPDRDGDGHANAKEAVLGYNPDDPRSHP